MEKTGLSGPYALRVEGLRDPIGLTETVPLFSWLGQTPGVPHRLCAEDRGREREWQSVWSDAPGPVGWQGWTLASREQVRWWVEAESADGVHLHSEPSTFEMGLLEPDDWSARWVCESDSLLIPRRKGVTGVRYFRRSFDCSEDAASARIYLSGVGFHQAWFDEESPFTNRLEPGFTRYDRRVLYVTYDVTEFLKRGKHTLQVAVANGWYNEEVSTAWQFDQAPWRGVPRLLFQIEASYGDGTLTRVVSDESVECLSGPVVSAGLRTGITVAAHQGWSEPHYVEVCSAPAGRLTAQQYPPVVELERFHPALIRNSGEDFDETSAAHVFDVGQNIAGGARIEFSDVRARRVVVRYGERLAWDGTVDQSDISKHVNNDGRFQQDELESVEVPVGAAGSGEPYNDMALETQFAYHGFRYIEVTGATVRSIEAFRLAMEFERVGSFRCSDDRVNSLVGLAERAFLSNWHSIPTDCPQREKNGWTADAHLATPFGLYTFAAESAYRKWVVDITDEQRGDGAIPGIVPTAGWGYEWGNGPAWDAALSVIPFTLYQMRGDTRTGARALPSLLRYIDWVESRITAEWSDTGTVRFGLGDWLPPYGSSQEHRCPAELTSTAYFYRIVSETAALAGACGRSGDASRCLSVALRVREAFNKAFLTDRGYAASDLTALSVPLAFGLVPAQSLQAVAQALLSEVVRCEYHFECGVLGTSTVLHALSAIGRRDVAWRMITQPGYPGYMDWIDRGATTLWESWQGDSSLNHVFFADVVAWIYAEIGGLRFAQPGRAVAEPWLPANLDWLEVTHQGSAERVMVRAERRTDGSVQVMSR